MSTVPISSLHLSLIHSSSTTTTFVESASGVTEGGRTGLTSMTTGVLFLLCLLYTSHVDALTEAFGTTCVAGMKNAVLGMDDRTVELQKEYNALVSQRCV